ncbi:hypothetical protein GJU40_02715 [Bacillus lacus]|uniref:N-acetyltransferase domain-containing protein n=1 Tax=Metabacillus lacus TaxID=1983721 RepID=A0A7X2IWQ9_9BACI|nr:hypothetical protein [Metabacillus lacus]MRX71081.1 hypothetical protein [Metabacillus lacus]
MYYQLKAAEEKDCGRLIDFINKAGVSSEGVEKSPDQFIILENGNHNIVACLGIEIIEGDGLLRTLVVSQHMDQAYILSLFQNILVLCKQKEVRNLYLITNKAAAVDLLYMLGFSTVSTKNLPSHMLQVKHVSKSTEVAGSIVMKKEVKENYQQSY